jgi:hypothetical protein
LLAEGVVPSDHGPQRWLAVAAVALGLPLMAVLGLLLRPPQVQPSAAVQAAQARLLATRQRLRRAAQELEWLDDSALRAAAETGIFTRTGVITAATRPRGGP